MQPEVPPVFRAGEGGKDERARLQSVCSAPPLPRLFIAWIRVMPRADGTRGAPRSSPPTVAGPPAKTKHHKTEGR